jgi:hypothetical protein
VFWVCLPEKLLTVGALEGAVKVLGNHEKKATIML